MSASVYVIDDPYVGEPLWDPPVSLENINNQFILSVNGFKEVSNKRGMYGNGQTMAIVSDHRSTDVS